MTDQEKAEKAAFFALIRADPANNDTRLVFADWCEEHGDMELAGMLRGGSEAWLQAFVRKLQSHMKESEYAEEWLTLTYQGLMELALQFSEKKDYGLTLDMNTAEHAYADVPEFWKHFQVMTGRAAPDDGDQFISCAC